MISGTMKCAGAVKEVCMVTLIIVCEKCGKKMLVEKLKATKREVVVIHSICAKCEGGKDEKSHALANR